MWRPWWELAFQEPQCEEGGDNGGVGWRGRGYLRGFPLSGGEPKERGAGQTRQMEQRARLWLDTVQRRRARPQTRWAPPHSCRHLEKQTVFTPGFQLVVQRRRESSRTQWSCNISCTAAAFLLLFHHFLLLMLAWNHPALFFSAFN